MIANVSDLIEEIGEEKAQKVLSCAEKIGDSLYEYDDEITVLAIRWLAKMFSEKSA